MCTLEGPDSLQLAPNRQMPATFICYTSYTTVLRFELPEIEYDIILVIRSKTIILNWTMLGVEADWVLTGPCGYIAAPQLLDSARIFPAPNHHVLALLAMHVKPSSPNGHAIGAVRSTRGNRYPNRWAHNSCQSTIDW